MSRVSRAAGFTIEHAVVVVMAIVAVTAAGCTSTAPGAWMPLSGGALDLPAGYLRIAGGVHPAARTEFDRGAVPGARRLANLSMVFKLSPAQRADREALKAALADPSSPSYRRFLGTQEYRERFGAPPASIDRARGWLASQGLEVHEDSPLGARVTFSGSVEKLQAAFRTEVRRYEVGGEQHYAMGLAPALPEDLHSVVAAITNTHDFHPRPALRHRPAPAYTQGKASGFAPPDWANVYDAARLYNPGINGHVIDGTGVTIAVVGVADIPQSDIDDWRSRFNLGAGPVTMTLVPNTGAPMAGVGGDGFEAVLDVEWAGGVAPGATIHYVYVGADSQNVDDATFYAIDHDLAPIVSESWGGCEEDYLAYGLGAADQNVIDVLGSAANVLGITYVAASGDEGATGCLAGGATPTGLYVSVPASYPGATAVGGTQFAKGALSGNPYFAAYSASEATWNESNKAPNLAAGGGGVSLLFDRPPFQAGIANCPIVGDLPVMGVDPSAKRLLPDVAFTSASGSGAVGLLVGCTIDRGTNDCSDTGGMPALHVGGGTSFATPAFAGVVALMNQAAGGRLGNVNPLLYTLALSTPAAFHDITAGDNEVVCKPGVDPGCGGMGTYGYPAAAGYDCATGLGSMDVGNAVAALAAQAATSTTLAVAPNPAMAGSPVTFTATVTVPHPNLVKLAGEVGFAFTSYDQKGETDLSWTLGTGKIVGGTTANGSATFSGVVPPGMVKPGMQTVDVVAMYGGDAAHLPSTSARVSLAFAPLSFTILPAMPSTSPLGKILFSTMGGFAPVRWYTGNRDTTCDNKTPPHCSTIDVLTGAFTAGPKNGLTDLFAVDADGEEAMVTVNVACMPLVACPPGTNCGSMPDGCGGTLTCGGQCTAPQTCGGGGTPNVCGCTPATQCPAGDDCGMVADGCGGMLSCGTCTAPQVCGGGSLARPNVCGCTPLTSCPASATCGGIADGCGGMLNCGACAGSATCVANRCVAAEPDGGVQPDGGSLLEASGGGCSIAPRGPASSPSAWMLVASAICNALRLGRGRRRSKTRVQRSERTTLRQ